MPAFIARVRAGVDDIVAAAGHEDTVAVFSHGGVINALVHDVMETERLLCVQVDYAGVTRLLWSSRRTDVLRGGRQRDRTRMGPAAAKPAVVDKSGDYDRPLRWTGSTSTPWTVTCARSASPAPVSCAASSSRAAGPT